MALSLWLESLAHHLRRLQSTYWRKTWKKWVLIQSDSRGQKGFSLCVMIAVSECLVWPPVWTHLSGTQVFLYSHLFTCAASVCCIKSKKRKTLLMVTEPLEEFPVRDLVHYGIQCNKNGWKILLQMKQGFICLFVCVIIILRFAKSIAFLNSEQMIWGKWDLL